MDEKDTDFKTQPAREPVVTLRSAFKISETVRHKLSGNKYMIMEIVYRHSATGISTGYRCGDGSFNGHEFYEFELEK